MTVDCKTRKVGSFTFPRFPLSAKQDLVKFYFMNDRVSNEAKRSFFSNVCMGEEALLREWNQSEGRPQ